MTTLHEEAAPERVALIAGTVLADALPEVARCTCDRCNPQAPDPEELIRELEAHRDLVQETLMWLAAGAPMWKRKRAT